MFIAGVCLLPLSLFTSIRNFCYCFLLFIPRISSICGLSIWLGFFRCLYKLDFFMFVFGDWRVSLTLVYSGSWCCSCINDTISLTDSFTKYSTEFPEFHTGHNIKTLLPYKAKLSLFWQHTSERRYSNSELPDWLLQTLLQPNSICTFG